MPKMSACREQDKNKELVKPVLLVVSFGTSYNDNRGLSIGEVEKAMERAYPDYEIRRAFTSQIIINKLEKRDNIKIDNVTEAMERLIADNVKDVVVMPTHIMNGYEYDDMVREASAYKEEFDSLKIGKALLTYYDDFNDLISVLTKETAPYNSDGSSIVFMGHGTEHSANSVYSTLQTKFHDRGFKNYFVGAVEGSPFVDEVLASVKGTDTKKVVLLPLMLVAGDHACNDMASDEDDSWKTIFSNAGYEVECILKGLGQYEGVRQMIVDHAGVTINE